MCVYVCMYVFVCMYTPLDMFTLIPETCIPYPGYSITGVGFTGPAEHFPMRFYRQQMDVNFFGYVCNMAMYITNGGGGRGVS